MENQICMEDRIQTAVALFKEGYNCSQSVVGAFADLYGFDQATAMRFAASFGGGIGRMRMTCGAACGLFTLVGLEKSAAHGADHETKSANYKDVQHLAQLFKEENGSLICAELLGLNKDATITPNAEARTESYYKKRPCSMMVETAARLFAEYYKEQHPEVIIRE